MSGEEKKTELEELLLTYEGVDAIISMAVMDWNRQSLPMTVGKRRILPNEVPNVLLINATLGYLNKHGLLNKIVKVDIE